MKDLFFKTYRLETITIRNAGKSYQKEKRYVRKIEVYELGFLKENQVFQILTRDYSFSNEDNSEGKLIKQISYLFDDIELLVDHDGNLLEVLNKDNLQTRWKYIKLKLSKQHKGSVIENYFRQLTELLEKEQELIDFLQEYHMLGLFFNGLWSCDERIRTKVTEGYTQIVIPEIVDGKYRQSIVSKDVDNKEASGFKGINFYSQNTLEESYIEIQENNHHFKYSLLWIG